MTKDEQNDFIGGIVEPDKCRHEWELVDANSNQQCKKCKKKLPYVVDIKPNTDYLTPAGTAKIMNWLEEQSLDHYFSGFVFERIIKKRKDKNSEEEPINISWADLYDGFKLAFSPEELIPEFIQYAKENNLGGK